MGGGGQTRQKHTGFFVNAGVRQRYRPVSWRRCIQVLPFCGGSYTAIADVFCPHIRYSHSMVLRSWLSFHIRIPISGCPSCRLGFDAIGFESNMEVIVMFVRVFLLNLVYGAYHPHHIPRPSISYIGVDGLAPVENAGNVLRSDAWTFCCETCLKC